jgi:hypothetical protein
LNNHHHLHHHHSVNSEPPDLTKIITWISSFLSEMFVPHDHAKHFVKEGRIQKGLFCKTHTLSCRLNTVCRVVTVTLVRNSGHFRKYDILQLMGLIHNYFWEV